jgi:transposase-like protein
VTTTTGGLAAARQAHSDRCRQRVIAALEAAVAAGEEISISLISRKANVDRSLLYRHRDLHALVLAQATVPPTLPSTGPSVSRTSLLTDLAATHDRVARLTRENTQLRTRLSETLGQHAWRESGLGAPDDVAHLQAQVVELDQQVAELRRQLMERDDELDAARAANRELIARLNRGAHPQSP